ncbi:MAG TPA: FAD-dependent oxidoreductase, partial [Cryomorphaceae bacterium]|nr:FAD-dependent oxidoreductase [Cryomorphaceae bacterium]
FSRTALMYVFMGHMQFEHTQPYENDFWSRNRLELLRDRVMAVDTDRKELRLQTGEVIRYHKLLLATGSLPNKFGWPGQDHQGVQGLYSKQDLELLEEYSATTERAVIVGGGLIGIELAEMLHSRNIPVTMLVREKNFWNSVLPDEESAMISRHIKEHHIDLRLESELEEILADSNGRVKAIKTKKGEEIECQLVGLTVGVHPNISFLEGSGIETNKGVLVNRRLETNVPDVYAAGDCAEQRQAIGERKAVEQVWYTGRMMGEVVAQNICGKRVEYAPDNWFNSAKFFDIEYQTYGWVWSKPKENEASLYWEHQDGKKALRLVYNTTNGALLGVNAFGIRLRHEVCDSWIRQKVHINEVVKALETANFDPEFYRRHEKAIRKHFKGRTAIA